MKESKEINAALKESHAPNHVEVCSKMLPDSF